MSTVTGTVERITEKHGQGARGPWTAYSLIIEGKFWNCGFSRPDVAQGDYVTFETKLNNRGYEEVNQDTLKKQAPPQGQAKSSGGGGQGTNWAAKDARISFNAATNTAVALVRLGFECGALKLPAKASEKFDAVKAMVDHEADRLFVRYMATNEDTADEIAAGMVSEGVVKEEPEWPSDEAA